MSADILTHGRGQKRETYNEFVKKFEPKKTTDDCLTPEPVYEAVAGWVADEYGLDRADFVRPFWPGGDFEHFDYPDGCVVVDNPPFSIIGKVLNFYMDAGTKFFLFTPALMIRSSLRREGICFVASGVSVTYENGAKVPTSFATNLEPEHIVRTAPRLYSAIKAIEEERKATKALPRYAYPDYLLTAAMANNLAKYGVEYTVAADSGRYVSSLDEMRKTTHKGIFGGGLLLSEKAAAEKAAAEKAAAEKAAAEKKNAIVWQLSDRERVIVVELSKN